jgi:hypothetical protein
VAACDVCDVRLSALVDEPEIDGHPRILALLRAPG